MINQSASAQRDRVLNYLKAHGSATTTEIRHRLDIMMPATRVHELRHDRNINIVRTWEYAHNPGGTDHRVARYVLLDGKYKEEAKA